MFNLTNVGLSMCVMKYSDSFPNLMTVCEPILAFMSGKKYEIIPTWRGKVGIVLILHGGRESCDDSCAFGASHTGRELLSSSYTRYFYCVIVIKHSMSLRRMESYIRISR